MAMRGHVSPSSTRPGRAGQSNFFETTSLRMERSNFKAEALHQSNENLFGPLHV